MTTHIMDQMSEPEAKGVCKILLSEQATEPKWFVARSGWTQLQDGMRLPQSVSSEPGEWGMVGSVTRRVSLRTQLHRDRDVCPVGDRAHFRSHARPGASEVLHDVRTVIEFKVEPRQRPLLDQAAFGPDRS